MEYKNQHFVTESYLRSWCDPATPNGAFVWVVSKKNRKISRKSPKSLFSEDDFYTHYDSNNNRYLELEHKLKEVEDRFILLRDGKLKHHISLTTKDSKPLHYSPHQLSPARSAGKKMGFKFGRITSK
ncbi:MAG: DUF4238 domain-containing protein [Anaerolineales bacterium]